MLNEMKYDLVFDRSLDKNKNYVSPGGFGIKTRRTGTVNFDFEDFFGTIDAKDPTVVHFDHVKLDTDSFPDAEKIISTDLQTAEFTEFFVYTGEYDEVELHPKEVKNLSFVFDDIRVAADHNLLCSVNKLLAD